MQIQGNIKGDFTDFQRQKGDESGKDWTGSEIKKSVCRNEIVTFFRQANVSNQLLQNSLLKDTGACC